MTAKLANKKRTKAEPSKLVREIYGGEVYEYYPLGEHIVAARGVCGGRPTIKYRRLDARHIIGMLKRGDSPQQISRNYRIPEAAVKEAIKLAEVYDYERSYA
jgi:uncharacterized protein (DUF433 family)